MADKRTLKFVLGIETKAFKSALSGVKREIQSFGGVLKSAFALGGLTMFGKSVVQAGKNFQDAMARVQAVSNATASQFEQMSEAARKFGRTTIYSATEAANGLEYLTRNGMSASQATASLGNVLKLAQANAIGLAEAADMLTNVMNMFGLSVQDGERIVDVLSSTASNTATNVSQLYQALINAAPAAKALNFSLEEVSSALGALAQRGVKAELAGTQLRMAMIKMADPKIVKKMQEMGVAIDEESMKSEGLLGTVNKLREAHLGLSDLVGIFSQKGAVGIQQLINSYEDFENILNVTENAAGTANRMFEQGVGSVRRELDILKNKWNEFQISLMNGGGVIKSVVRGMQNLIDNFKTVGGTILNIASVTVPLLMSNFQKLARVWSIASKQIVADALAVKVATGQIIGVVATLVTWVGTALYGAWNRNHQIMRDAKKQMASVASETAKLQADTNALVNKLGPDTDKSTLAGVVNQLTKMFPDFATAIKNAADEASKTGNWEKFRNLLQEIVGLQGQIMGIEANKAIINAEADAIARRMQKAGESGVAPSGANEIPQAITAYYKKNYGRKQAKELTEKAFRDIASIIVTYGGDVAKAAAETKKYLEVSGINTANIGSRYKGTGNITISSGNVTLTNEKGEKIDFTPGQYVIDPFLQAFSNTVKTIGGDRLTSMQGAEGRNAAEEKDIDSKADSLNISRAIGSFEASIANLDKQLKAHTITQKGYDNEVERLRASTYEQIKDYKTLDSVLSNLGKSDLKNTLKAAYDRQQKVLNGGSGGSGGGGGEELKGPQKQVKEAVDNYKEGVIALSNRLQAGTITEEKFNEELDELEDRTWEALTAISNFKDILAELGVAGFDLSQQYKENRNNEKDASFMEARDKQYSALAGYTFPIVNRDKTFDKWKTKDEIFEAEVDLSFDYRDKLQDIVDDLQEKINNGEFNLINEDAIELLEWFKQLLKEAKQNAKDLGDELEYAKAIKKVEDELDELKSKAGDSITTIAQSFERIYDAITNLMEAFGAEISEEAAESWKKFFAVMNAGVQILETVKSVTEAVQIIQDLAAKKKAKNALIEIASDKMVAEGEKEKAKANVFGAAAGAANSVASIPYVGAILAVAAVASVIAAIMSATKGFAKGGFIPGNRGAGDTTLVRTTPGELVLNAGQQRNLFDLINNGGTVGKTVNFRLKGSDLIGAIENENMKRRG